MNRDPAPDVSFIPAAIPTDGGLDFVGRMTDGGTAAGARLRHDTRCVVCGEGFRGGDPVKIDLAADWDAAQYWHERCGRPAPRLD